MLPSIREMVGATGFEPATFSSRTRRATKLRYAPKDGAHSTEKVLLHKGLAEKFFCPTSLWAAASEFLDGNDLILVDLRGFAVELFELVEA